MTRDRRTRTSALRAANDQPGAVQRRSTARGAQRARSPPPISTTSAATSRSPRTTARSRSAAPSSARSPSRSTTCEPCPRSSGPSPSSAPATVASTCDPSRSGNRGATTPSRPPAGPAPSSVDVLERARPADDGVEVRFEGADSGPYHLHPILADTDKDDLTFVRSLPLALAADPAAEILIAYEMNGEPLRPDHGAPFRIIVPHWFAVASVKWLHRIDVLTEPYAGEFQTGHYIYEWPDRPHEPVTLMRVRARITDPAPGAVLPLGTHTVRGKAWSGTGPITTRRGQPHRRRRLAASHSSSHPTGRTTGRTGRSTGRRLTSAGTPCVPERPTPPATSNPRSHRGTGSATATTPSKSRTSTSASRNRRHRGA